MASEGREVVRVEFETGKTKKFIPKARHIQDAMEASKRSVGEMLEHWPMWPYLIRALLLEVDPTLTHIDACELMDTYMETHAGDKEALKKLGRAIGTAVARYASLEMKVMADEKVDGARPTLDASA